MVMSQSTWLDLETYGTTSIKKVSSYYVADDQWSGNDKEATLMTQAQANIILNKLGASNLTVVPVDITFEINKK